MHQTAAASSTRTVRSPSAPIPWGGSLTSRAVIRIANVVARRAVARRVRGRLRAASALHAERIPTFTLPEELESLLVLAESCPAGAAVVEVGAYLGAASCYLAAGLHRRGGTLYCIDTWENQTMPEGARDTFKEFTENTSRLTRPVVPIRKASRDIVRDDLPSEVHMAFIDGDHSYAAVAHDFAMVEPLIAAGGVVAFHDIASFQGVAKVVGEALASGGWAPEGCVANLLWIRRQVFPRP